MTVDDTTLPEAKPHKGTIDYWVREEIPEGHGLGFVIRGLSSGHPQFDGELIRTRFVVSRDGDSIETLNSRYTLGKPAASFGKPAAPPRWDPMTIYEELVDMIENAEDAERLGHPVDAAIALGNVASRIRSHLEGAAN